jgi:hypothetical protein
MASTRNKNTPGNYCLEQRKFHQFEHYTLYKNSQYGEAYHTQFAGNGLNPAQIPWNQLSNNAADTESFLFGINATNLVKPAPIFVPEIKNHCSVNLYEKQPTIIPNPLIIEKNQRPYPV